MATGLPLPEDVRQQQRVRNLTTTIVAGDIRHSNPPQVAHHTEIRIPIVATMEVAIQDPGKAINEALGTVDLIPIPAVVQEVMIQEEAAVAEVPLQEAAIAGADQVQVPDRQAGVIN